MSSVVNAASFIKANMPLSQGNSLTDAEAWDVAAYIDSRERPQDPRFTGDLAATARPITTALTISTGRPWTA